MDDFLMYSKLKRLASKLRVLSLGDDLSLDGMIKVIKEADDKLAETVEIKETVDMDKVKELEIRLEKLQKENDELRLKVSQLGESSISRELLEECVYSGFSALVIGEMLGVSHTTINKHLKKYSLNGFEKVSRKVAISIIKSDLGKWVGIGVSEKNLNRLIN